MNSVNEIQAYGSVEQWLCPQEVVLDTELPNRHLLLELAATMIGRKHGLEAAPIFRALWRREQIGTTALGQGVAIPHARIEGIERPLTLFIRNKYAIDCAAPDGMPVSNFLIIMVPADGHTDDHLQLLALVAQTFSDRNFREGLSMASTPSAIKKLFTLWADRKSRS